LKFSSDFSKLIFFQSSFSSCQVSQNLWSW